MKKNKGSVIFIAVIVIAVALSAFRIVRSFSDGADGGSYQAGSGQTVFKDFPNFDFSFNGKKRPSHNSPYIARLYITGTIQEAGETYNQQWLMDTINELQDDKNNLAIVLYIDSPGGSVYESDETYLRLLKYAEYIDLTGLMDKYGIKSKTVHSGKNKTMGSYDEPFSKEQQDIMQALCDECYEQFTGIVAQSRKLPIEQVRKLADGRVYTAKQAKENKLIDAVGSWEELLDVIAAAGFEDVYYDVEDYSYEPEQGLYKYLLGLADKLGGLKAERSTGLPDALQKIIEPEIRYPAYLYRK